jgi:hypothetical protein
VDEGIVCIDDDLALEHVRQVFPDGRQRVIRNRQ